MKRETAYLADILIACETIGEYVQNQTFETFANNQMLRDAVNYQLVIIGEATRYLSDPTKAMMPQIPWPAVRRTRNIIVHDYGKVDESIIWETVTTHVPLLADAVRPLVPVEE